MKNRPTCQVPGVGVFGLKIALLADLRKPCLKTRSLSNGVLSVSYFAFSGMNNGKCSMLNGRKPQPSKQLLSGSRHPSGVVGRVQDLETHHFL